MTTLKTKKNDSNVEDFLNSVSDEKKKSDSFKILNLMQEITQEKPFMYGTSIVGFGAFNVTYASGRESNWFQAGFSPRKQALTLYIMDGFDNYQALLESLGKHKTGKSCLYIKNLDDVDFKVLTQLISESVQHLKNK